MLQEEDLLEVAGGPAPVTGTLALYSFFPATAGPATAATAATVATTPSLPAFAFIAATGIGAVALVGAGVAVAGHYFDLW